jgi:hypothetical protein
VRTVTVLKETVNLENRSRSKFVPGGNLLGGTVTVLKEAVNLEKPESIQVPYLVGNLVVSGDRLSKEAINLKNRVRSRFRT